MTESKVVLITGAAQRIGAAIAKYLHGKGYNLVIHYNSAVDEAKNLEQQLNKERENSCICLAADFADIKQISPLVTNAANHWQRLDALINNASAFFPTKSGATTEEQWDILLDCNLKAPFFLSQAAQPWLQKHHGCIVNISDIHSQHPLKNYPVYSISKAGLEMLTKALAKELGPTIRVNAIAPGAIMWPEEANALSTKLKEEIIARTVLKRAGDAQDIAKAAYFLIADSDYTTGQILAIDGGRSL